MHLLARCDPCLRCLSNDLDRRVSQFFFRNSQVCFIEDKTIRWRLFYTNGSYLKNFENTDADFDEVRFGLDVVVG